MNPINRLVGEKRVVYIYLALALALEVSELFFAFSFISLHHPS